MWTPSDSIEAALDRYDNDDREWVLRYRLFLSRWFPYRTAPLDTDVLAETGDWDAAIGTYTWHPPDRGPIRWLMSLRRPQSREDGA